MDTSVANASSDELPARRSKLPYRLLKTFLTCYLATCLLMMFLERQLIFHPPAQLDNAGEIRALGGEEVSFESPDGTRISGFYFAHEDPQRGLLYTYGNGEDAARNAEYMAYLRDILQASVLICDYRGYGRSEGLPEEAALVEDGLAAQRWLADKIEVEPSEIALFGRSLGGGVAVAIAERQGAQALIVHSSFANMVDVGAAAYPWLPVRLLMKNRFESETRIKNFDGPLLQIHGTADEIVPLRMARPLFEASPSSQKQFLELPDGTHNDGLDRGSLKALVEFLNSLP